MNSDGLTPAVRQALRVWYRAKCGERRLEQCLAAGQTPPYHDDDSQVRRRDAAWVARFTLSPEEKAAQWRAMRRMMVRLGWRGAVSP